MRFHEVLELWINNFIWDVDNILNCLNSMLASFVQVIILARNYFFIVFLY